MKPILSEKNCVIILFILVLITFALAQEDSRKMEKAYQGATISSSEVVVPGEVESGVISRESGVISRKQ